MSLNSLINNAVLIKTAIQPMNHHIPVTLERKRMYLQAVAQYSYYPIEDTESNLEKYSTNFNPFKQLHGLQYGEAILAIEPIPYTLNGDELIQAYDKLSERLAEYTNTYSSLFNKAEKGGYIGFHDISVHEPDFDLKCNGHLLELTNITDFFENIGLKQELVKTQVLRDDINIHPNIYYFKVDNDQENLALKITIQSMDHEDPQHIVQNIEMVKISDSRDEVLKSVQQFVIDSINENLEFAGDEFFRFINIVNGRNNIVFADLDLPF